MFCANHAQRHDLAASAPRSPGRPLATNQLEYVAGLDPKMAARWADAVRVHAAKNADLGRQLAETYALAGRVDDAIAMVEAALKAGYEDPPWNPMRTDKKLSVLFKDPRFQARRKT